MKCQKHFVHAKSVNLTELVCTEQCRCELEVGECDNAEYTAVQDNDD